MYLGAGSYTTRLCNNGLNSFQGYLNDVNTECALCPAGKVTPESGRTTCSSCGAGTYTGVSTGASACINCQAGKFGASSAQTECVRCPIGTFSAMGATVCTSCSSGEWTESWDPSIVEGTVIPPSYVGGAKTYINVPLGPDLVTACSSCAVGNYHPPTTVNNGLSAGFRIVVAANGDWIIEGNYLGQINTQSNTGQVDMCKPCPIGTFNPSGQASTCQNCVSGISFASSTGASICTICSTAKCGIGEYISSNCIATTNKDCASCPGGQIVPYEGSYFPDKSSCTLCTAGTYSNPERSYCFGCGVGKFSGIGASICTECPIGTFTSYTETKVCTTCENGKYQTATNADRCIPCDVGKYQGLFTSKGVVCTIPCLTCDPGTYETRECNGNGQNRECKVCSLECVDGSTYETTSCTPNTNRFCTSCVTCTNTQYQDVACSRTQVNTCKDLTTCTPDTSYQIIAPTQFMDRTCGPCNTCTASVDYETTRCSGNQKRVCSQCSNPICTTGNYRSSLCNVTHDRACLPILVCVNGTQYGSVLPTVNSNRICSNCNTCQAGNYEVEACTPMTNRQCATCSICMNESYETNACTNKTNRGCTNCNTCMNGTYETAACTNATNRVCTTCRASQCGVETFQTTPCTPITNKICMDCNKCGIETYETVACNVSTNRICSQCQICNIETYETSPCTNKTNRKCDNCRPQCSSDTYESIACTSGSNRVCSDCIKCKGDEYEASPCTRNSNRVCLSIMCCSVKKLYTGVNHSCVILNNDRIKCWGANLFGQLGYGDIMNRGDHMNEMGDYLPYVNVGTGRTVKAMALGSMHSCAILDNDLVKCWGLSVFGVSTNQMGDRLNYINLGLNRTAKNITSGVLHTCVITDVNDVRCWGSNSNGQLGNGDTIDRGNVVNTTNIILSAVNLGFNNLGFNNLGFNQIALSISAGYNHTCVITNLIMLKCWGKNNAGQLGYQDTVNRGSTASQMGNVLGNVNLGSNITITSIKCMGDHSCAIFTDGRIKCWGDNRYGQLGMQNNDFQNLGDGTNEMSNNLPFVAIALTYRVIFIDGNQFHTCVILDDKSLRCWGQYFDDVLKHNISSNKAFDFVNSIGVNSVTVGLFTTCVITSSNLVKCWGMGGFGATGMGNTMNFKSPPVNELFFASSCIGSQQPQCMLICGNKSNTEYSTCVCASNSYETTLITRISNRSCIVCNTSCASGFYVNVSCSTNKNTLCDECPMGYYCVNSTRYLCDAGSFNSETGRSACTMCDIGFYSSTVGASNSSTCNGCPIGQITGQLGSTSSNDCADCPSNFRYRRITMDAFNMNTNNNLSIHSVR